MDQDQRYKEARKRVKSIKDFYQHLAVYIAVIGMLIGIDIVTGYEGWFIYPALGWGVGIAIHGMNVFILDRFGKEWEERKIRELMGETPKRKNTSSDDYFEEV